MNEQSYILPKFYRNLAILFFLISIGALFLIFYLSWTKLTIVLTLKTEKVGQEMIFNISENSDSAPGSVPGRILEIDMQESANFPATGKKQASTDIVGEVTIVNNYSKEQKMIATTRLASFDKPDLVLVRLKNDVTVLPGKSVKVQVYAENPDTFVEIKPMKFIIPGLWEPLREKIYAENQEILTKGSFGISILAENDIKDAENKLKEKLQKQALDETSEKLDSSQLLWPKLFTFKTENSTSSAQIGQEASEFTLDIKLKAVVIAFAEDKLADLAESRIREKMVSGQKTVSLDKKSFSYEVQSYDLENKTASVKVKFESEVSTGDIDSIDKSKITGLSENEIRSYFAQFSKIKEIEIIFQPSLISKAPKNKDKINIEISK